MYTRADLERLTPYVRELSRKQYVTAQSLEKIEDGKRPPSTYRNLAKYLHIAAYAIVVRGSEYDLPPERLDDIVALSVSSFGSRDRRHKRANMDRNDEDDER
jgi:hypothetical protein